ncbi:MAG: right-handed parallel beta-helix repeat-containing protein [bacterium]
MKKTIFGIFMALGFLAFKPIWAETYVSGTITSNTTWALANSPYVATDTVIVVEGVILTVEPGVTVRFATNTSLICYGTLRAVGNPDGTITFTSDQATHTAGYWNGIVFSGTNSSNSILTHCTIMYAGRSGVGISFYNTSPRLSNCIISEIGRLGHNYGIICSNSSPILTNNVISEIKVYEWYTAYGIYIINSSFPILIGNKVSGIRGDYLNSRSRFGIYISNSVVTITGGTVTDINGGYARAVYGIYVYQSTVNITQNNFVYINGIHKSPAYGIYLDQSTATISYNIISNIVGGITMGINFAENGYGIFSSSSIARIDYNDISSIVGGYGSGGYGGNGYGIMINNDKGTLILKNNIFNVSGGGSTMGVFGVGYGIYVLSGSNPGIHYNNILNNKNGNGTKGFGVYCDGTAGTISATFNWWGHNSGPYHLVTNSSGQGDKISDYIDYIPWLTVAYAPSHITVNC